MRRILLSLLLLAAPVLAADETLDIYWIDVEGGAATLIVTPQGETVLMDAGWPGAEDRDPKRIVNVLKYVAKKERLNYFITSHFHADHVGGLPALAKMVTIEKFVDHGDSVEKDVKGGKRLWDAYLATVDGRRMTIKPGDKLPLEGVDFRFVAAASKFISKPIGKRKKNPLCADAVEKDEPQPDENGKSVGFMIRIGKFEFLDLGDLTWDNELKLACPVNLLGEVDLYQVTHHGMDMSGAPPHIRAINPQVAVMNNGHRKGGRPQTYKTLTSTPGLVDLWQLHKVLAPDGAPNTDEKMIANLEATNDGDKGHWIRASVKKNGEFTITNSRNNYSKTYEPR